MCARSVLSFTLWEGRALGGSDPGRQLHSTPRGRPQQPTSGSNPESKGREWALAPQPMCKDGTTIEFNPLAQSLVGEDPEGTRGQSPRPGSKGKDLDDF